MTELTIPGERPRSRGWWLFVLFIFAAHVGAIFWLSDRSRLRPKPARPSPVLQLAGGGCDELLELRDPTLFALPRQRGFSALAWGKSRPPVLRSPDWSEPPRWLEPKLENLGADFLNSPLTNAATPLVTPSMPEPEILTPEAPPLRLDDASRLVVLCNDPEVRLVTPLALPSWPPRAAGTADADLLTNTVVQVMVGSHGKALSVSLLSSSGSGQADEYALRESRSAAFEVPAPDPSKADKLGILAGLHWCQLVFQWHTVASTNAPAPPP